MLEKQIEKEQVIPLGTRLKEKWGKTNTLYSISLDKGFTTELGKQSLQKKLVLCQRTKIILSEILCIRTRERKLQISYFTNSIDLC